MNKLTLPVAILVAVILAVLAGAFIWRYAMVPTGEGALAYRLDRWTGEIWGMSRGGAQQVLPRKVSERTTQRAPQIVDIPEVGRVEFPGSMSEADIAQTIERDILGGQPSTRP